MLRRTSATAAVLSLGLALAPLPAFADDTTVITTCGGQITTDARLGADLTCAEDQGIVITAPVTLDLAGYTLRGPGADRWGIGISVDAPANVVITNGTIAGWGDGVRTLGDGRHWDRTVTVHGVHFEGNGNGVYVSFQRANVDGSTFESNWTGARSFTGTLHIADTQFLKNEEGTDFVVSRGSMTRVTFEGNGLAMYCSESGIPIHASTVRNNTAGIFKDICGLPRGVTNSRFEGNEVAYRSGWTASTDELIGNTFLRNGTAIDAGAGGVVRNNTFKANGTALTSTMQENDASLVVQSNNLTRNGDAIYLPYTPASVHGNVAIRNTGWGIYAPFATDSGDNIARRNGNDPQCVGVACRAK